MSNQDVDPAELQEQLLEIKGAMGLEEQYPGRARLWLVGGLLIGLAAVLVQLTYAFNEELSGSAYAAVWVAFLVVAVVAAWQTAARLPPADPPANAPNWRAVFGAVFVFVAVLSNLMTRVADYAPGLEVGTMFFGSVIAAVGLGLLLTGSVLSAYHISRRDRLVFYGGGAWVLVFTVIYPHVELLRYVGIGLFGLLFMLYAVASWRYLRE